MNERSDVKVTVSRDFLSLLFHQKTSRALYTCLEIILKIIEYSWSY
jgi:hypothetical protein